MCGIAGLIVLNGQPVAERLVSRLCATLRHRGPDDDGYYLDGSVALGHCRLAILDLDTGHQPLSNEDGTVWVIFNGEIYNFAEVRQPLEALGHRFATRSDTEVIVHAWEQYGPDCVKRLRGM